jgi:hypothetical protein
MTPVMRPERTLNALAVAALCVLRASAGPHGPPASAGGLGGVAADGESLWASPLDDSVITVGRAHACALAVDDTAPVGGRARCWGSSRRGQLAAPVRQPKGLLATLQPPPPPTSPVPCVVVHPARLQSVALVQVAASDDWTCGVTAATAELVCWGPAPASLGLGYAQAVLERGADDAALHHVSCGATHVCGIAVAHGGILCFGAQGVGGGGVVLGGGGGRMG